MYHYAGIFKISKDKLYAYTKDTEFRTYIIIIIIMMNRYTMSQSVTSTDYATMRVWRLLYQWHSCCITRRPPRFSFFRDALTSSAMLAYNDALGISIILVVCITLYRAAAFQWCIYIDRVLIGRRRCVFVANRDVGVTRRFVMSL